MYRIFLLVIASLFFCGQKSSARQLYIQPGEDIKTAIENLVAGDTLWVKTGTYQVSDLINVRKSGSSSHRICVFGYDSTPGDKPAVNPVFDFSTQPHTV